MTVLRSRRLPDFLVVGQEAWDQIERRNQRMIRALAIRNPGSRFLFAELALRPRQMREWRPFRLVQVGANVWRLPLIRPLPDRASARLSDLAEAHQIARAARSLGLHRPYVWTQNPHGADLIDLLPAAGLVYDLTDDWAAFESNPKRRTRVQAQVDELTRRADVVFACSPSLCDAARRSGTHPIYLPNAVDGIPRERPVAPELARFPRPRLGYAGTLHASRLDVDLIVGAADLRPYWSFVFLGPDLLGAADRARLFSRANVHALGSRPHHEVADYVAGFDVGLVPNRITEFTSSLDPLKTYEYLAGGVPVVSTAAGVAPALAEHVHIASTPAEVVAQAERLIVADGPAQAEARKALVALQTWDSRAATVERALTVRTQEATTEVSAVIVSFNTNELLERCLTALRNESVGYIQTIVVDNGSTDGSQALVRGRFPEVELVELEENVGFGRANNVAFDRCRGDFVLLLNSDAFLHPGSLDELVAAAGRHPEAAVIGPRLLNPDGTLQRSAWPFPRASRLLLEALGLHRIVRMTPYYEDLGVWSHSEERRVDFLVGACLLVRACALEEVEGFDEDYYMYGEEADLQQRLSTRGWSAILAPRAIATHVGGASSINTIARLYQFYGSQFRFLGKHRGPGSVIAARLALLIGSALRRRWDAMRVALHGPRDAGQV